MLVITGYKLAVLFNYLEIFGTVNTFPKKLIIVVLVITFISHLTTTLVILLQCWPVQKSWQPLSDGTCLPNFETWIVG
jgi:hypothetical protein